MEEKKYPLLQKRIDRKYPISNNPVTIDGLYSEGDEFMSYIDGKKYSSGNNLWHIKKGIYHIHWDGTVCAGLGEDHQTEFISPQNMLYRYIDVYDDMRFFVDKDERGCGEMPNSTPCDNKYECFEFYNDNQGYCCTQKMIQQGFCEQMGCCYMGAEPKMGGRSTTTRECRSEHVTLHTAFETFWDDCEDCWGDTCWCGNQSDALDCCGPSCKMETGGGCTLGGCDQYNWPKGEIRKLCSGKINYAGGDGTTADVYDTNVDYYCDGLGSLAPNVIQCGCNSATGDFEEADLDDENLRVYFHGYGRGSDFGWRLTDLTNNITLFDVGATPGQTCGGCRGDTNLGNVRGAYEPVTSPNWGIHEGHLCGRWKSGVWRFALGDGNYNLTLYNCHNCGFSSNCAIGSDDQWAGSIRAVTGPRGSAPDLPYESAWGGPGWDIPAGATGWDYVECESGISSAGNNAYVGDTCVINSWGIEEEFGSLSYDFGVGVPGCLDIVASNYDDSVTYDDGTCEYDDHYWTEMSDSIFPNMTCAEACGLSGWTKGCKDSGCSLLGGERGGLLIDYQNNSGDNFDEFFHYECNYTWTTAGAADDIRCCCAGEEIGDASIPTDPGILGWQTSAAYWESPSTDTIVNVWEGSTGNFIYVIAYDVNCLLIDDCTAELSFASANTTGISWSSVTEEANQFGDDLGCSATIGISNVGGSTSTCEYGVGGSANSDIDGLTEDNCTLQYIASTWLPGGEPTPGGPWQDCMNQLGDFCDIDDWCQGSMGMSSAQWNTAGGAFGSRTGIVTAKVTYNVGEDFDQTAQITVTVTDSTGRTGSRIFNIAISSTNDPHTLVATGGILDVDQGETGNFDFTIADSDAIDTYAVTCTVSPAGGFGDISSVPCFFDALDTQDGSADYETPGTYTIYTRSSEEYRGLAIFNLTSIDTGAFTSSTSKLVNFLYTGIAPEIIGPTLVQVSKSTSKEVTGHMVDYNHQTIFQSDPTRGRGFVNHDSAGCNMTDGNKPEANYTPDGSSWLDNTNLGYSDCYSNNAPIGVNHWLDKKPYNFMNKERGPITVADLYDYKGGRYSSPTWENEYDYTSSRYQKDIFWSMVKFTIYDSDKPIYIPDDFHISWCGSGNLQNWECVKQSLLLKYARVAHVHPEISGNERTGYYDVYVALSPARMNSKSPAGLSRYDGGYGDPSNGSVTTTVSPWTFHVHKKKNIDDFGNYHFNQADFNIKFTSEAILPDKPWFEFIPPNILQNARLDLLHEYYHGNDQYGGDIGADGYSLSDSRNKTKWTVKRHTSLCPAGIEASACMEVLPNTLPAPGYSELDNIGEGTIPGHYLGTIGGVKNYSTNIEKSYYDVYGNAGTTIKMNVHPDLGNTSIDDTTQKWTFHQPFTLPQHNQHSASFHPDKVLTFSGWVKWVGGEPINENNFGYTQASARIKKRDGTAIGRFLCSFSYSLYQAYRDSWIASADTDDGTGTWEYFSVKCTPGNTQPVNRLVDRQASSTGYTYQWVSRWGDWPHGYTDRFGTKFRSWPAIQMDFYHGYGYQQCSQDAQIEMWYSNGIYKFTGEQLSKMSDIIADGEDALNFDHPYLIWNFMAQRDEATWLQSGADIPNECDPNGDGIKHELYTDDRISYMLEIMIGFPSIGDVPDGGSSIELGIFGLNLGYKDVTGTSSSGFDYHDTWIRNTDWLVSPTTGEAGGNFGVDRIALAGATTNETISQGRLDVTLPRFHNIGLEVPIYKLPYSYDGYHNPNQLLTDENLDPGSWAPISGHVNYRIISGPTGGAGTDGSSADEQNTRIEIKDGGDYKYVEISNIYGNPDVDPSVMGTYAYPENYEAGNTVYNDTSVPMVMFFDYDASTNQTPQCDRPECYAYNSLNFSKDIMGAGNWCSDEFGATPDGGYCWSPAATDNPGSGGPS